MKNKARHSDIMVVAVRFILSRGLVACLCLAGLAVAASTVPLPPRVSPQPALQSPDAFFNQVQTLLQKKDLAGYLDLVSPDLRGLERDRLTELFNDFQMDSVRLKLQGKRTGGDGPTRLYCQAYFENGTTVMLEFWQLTLALRDGRWEVAAKDISGNGSRLYKIRIPGGRSERVRSVEIAHRDIRLSFKDAVVFYDNLPDVNTAFIVIGKGSVRFSPSDAIERHQVELLYGKPFLEDDVEEAYIRCSGSFASARLQVERQAGLPAVTPAEEARAAALFARSYPRSFTIESSMDREYLSLLPQGDEAVFDFKARRAGELTYIYYPFSDEEISLYDRSKERIISLYSPADEGNLREKRFYVSFADRYDIDQYQLDLSYSPSNSYLSAKARISIVSRTPALDMVKFRFNPDLEILKIYDQEKRELFYTRDKIRKLLYVSFISPPAPQSKVWIEVYYRGRMHPPVPTTDVIAQETTREKFVLRPRYETALFTQSGLWYPEPPQEDYFQARLKLVVPPEYRCIASGELVENGRWNEMNDVVEIEKAGNAVYTFQTKSPIKYMSFIVGKFDRPKEASDPIPVKAFVSTEVMEGDPALVDTTRSILDYYIRSFGPYPFEKLDVVRRLFPTAGGHSPASFIVLNVRPWIGDPHPVISDSPVTLTAWDEYFLAHELAHQWWGQGVSYLTYKDQWLSEGLAQFAAASYLRSKYGERAFAAILGKFAKWVNKKSVKGPISIGSRLSYYDFEAYQAVIYDKAALSLFMLQDILGPDVFFAGLKEFFAKFKYTAARTDNFIAVMERVSGRDLRDFFEGWFHSWELPAVQTSWSEERAPSGVRLRIRVSQTRGRFVFPLWVEWTSRGQAHREMLVVDKSSQEFELALPEKPERVVFNPLRVVPGKIS